MCWEIFENHEHQEIGDILKGLVSVPFWVYWTSPYSSHLVDHIPFMVGWCSMGTWLMTHVLATPGWLYLMDLQWSAVKSAVKSFMLCLCVSLQVPKDPQRLVKWSENSHIITASLLGRHQAYRIWKKWAVSGAENLSMSGGIWWHLVAVVRSNPALRQRWTRRCCRRAKEVCAAQARAIRSS